MENWQIPQAQHGLNEGLVQPLEPDQRTTPLVLRLGAVLGGGALAALVGSLPAVLRIGDGSVSRSLAQWLALAALLLPVGIVSVFVARNAPAGARILAPGRGVLLGSALLWGAMLELGLLSVFGTLLRRFTHHHALAGVTFAAFALVSGIGVALFSVRAGKMLGRFDERLQKGALWLTVGAVALALLLIAIRTARSEELHTAGALVDVLVVGATAAFAGSPRLRDLRPIAIAGTPLATLVFLLGLSVIYAMPELRALLATGAPVQAFVFGLFSSGG